MDYSIGLKSSKVPVESTGVWFYPAMPEGMRPATPGDLFLETKEPQDTWPPKAGKWYLIESFLRPGTFEAYRLSPYTTVADLELWFEAEKIWVKG